MNADELIVAILSAHESDSKEPLEICEGLTLEPQLNYSGKMARDAYRYGRFFMNQKRTYAGLLDFKIFQKGAKMEHEVLIESVVKHLPLGSFQSIHNGDDPFEIKDLDDEQLYLACSIQAGFIEQEVNWGIEEWQLWTYFGNTNAKDPLLRNSAPRDFQTVYIEKCMDETTRSQEDPKDVIHQIVSPYMKTTREAKNKAIMPPLDGKTKHIVEDFRRYMPASIYQRPTEKWIEPYIDRVKKLCKVKGPNPFHPDQGK